MLNMLSITYFRKGDFIKVKDFEGKPLFLYWNKTGQLRNKMQNLYAFLKDNIKFQDILVELI